MKLNKIQDKLANEDNIFAYAIIGIVVGFITSLVVTAFKLGFETPAILWLPNGSKEGFESLSVLWRFLLPVLGGISLGLVFYFFKLSSVRTGLPHTVYVVQKLHAVFPKRNIVVQFFGGIIALLTGQSVGQEGPAVHLGAGTSAIAAQKSGIPSNNFRIFAGCGTAAAIAAAFNTPLAGVIFAMEVVLLEYSIAGFIPIITAAVTASFIHKIVWGDQVSMLAANAEPIVLAEMLWLVLMALCVAAISALFVTVTRFGLRFSQTHVILRFTVAGLITGSLAIFVPQIMGTGYDTIGALFSNHISTGLILLIVFAKIIATGSAVGLGIPGGLIGPSLVMGACVGGAFSAIAYTYFPELSSNNPYYVLLGMAAMMSAAINAPLAAIIYIVELSYNPFLVFPGLVVVILANVFHNSLFKQCSVVSLVFKHQGLNIQSSVFSQALSRRNVMTLMNKNLIEVESQNIEIEPKAELEFIVSQNSGQFSLKALKDKPTDWLETPCINTTASLMQAWQLMTKNNLDYLICTRKTKTENLLIGVISLAAIKQDILKP